MKCSAGTVAQLVEQQAFNLMVVGSTPTGPIMTMTRNCKKCGEEFDVSSRIGKPGRLSECEDCAVEFTVRYTGNMVYDHKTGCAVQINADPNLTAYIRKATALRNKGSNLRNNMMVSYKTKGSGRCVTTVGGSNAKGKMV